jgi:hypothetical protein
MFLQLMVGRGVPGFIWAWSYFMCSVKLKFFFWYIKCERALKLVKHVVLSTCLILLSLPISSINGIFHYKHDFDHVF